MLRQNLPYKYLGADDFERSSKAQLAKQLLRRLEDLGVHDARVPTAQEA
ncbi:hypothetical protein HV824_35185 [Myxococcus sp. AM009]|nr:MULTISPECIES: hypothetical protein [unclassified Myxococcus]NVJ03322.1 hypothetical protein [Myxococcus sp. AM009]NVJ19516.1 hypothetical protein [Myxococcus sp. AM010]